MTSSEYRNTVYWTLHAHTPADETDLLVTARRIFNNLGVPFPQGTLADAIQILSSGDYMGWSICNADLAQQCANNGYPAIAVNENTLSLILPEEHTIAVNSPVAAVDHPIIWESGSSSSAQYFVFARLLDNNDVTLKNSDVVSQQNSGIMVAAATTTTCSSSCQVACQSCNACQTSCELNCQTGCQVSCQTTCQASCQTGCQVSCQSCNTCQAICETSCQSTCQTNCQTGCEVACQSCNTCQSSCESTCQDTCQTSCQTGCQISCQSCDTCQSNCELSCQTGCQVSCQSCNSCQATCESVCQDSCESSCQTACQSSCQTNETNTELTPPTNVTVTAISPTTATVSWNNVNGATGYNLYLNNGLVYNVINPICHLTNLSAGTQYTCRIQAYNHSGSTSPMTIKEFTTKLNTPNMLKASNVNFDFVSNGASVTLSWSTVRGATGYHLIMDDNIRYSVVNSHYTIRELSIGSSHRFRVIAYNDAGVSDESEYCEVNLGSQNYNAALAKKCAEYALLAYDEMALNLDNRYYDSQERGDRRSEVLINKLQADGYSHCVSVNYNDEKSHNVSYVLARKPIVFNDINRTLVSIIIRGTDSVEWKGNMDITNTSYDPTMNEHYSFKQAEVDIRTNSHASLSRYLTEEVINNPIYLITGHSRGAAVANLLADTLSTTANPENVFAYTFATPNNVKSSMANTSRTNIYNFCFNDDFVPQVPLADWGYSKHGITFVETAETLYSNNSLFKNDLDVYAADSNKGNVSFSLLATNTLISSVLEYWTSTQEYYEKTYNMDSNDLSSSLWTLYHFFREVIAPAAMGEVMGYINIAPFMNVSGIFNRIASFFVHGSAIRNYVYFGHHAFTYYSAIKHDLFN